MVFLLTFQVDVISKLRSIIETAPASSAVPPARAHRPSVASVDLTSPPAPNSNSRIPPSSKNITSSPSTTNNSVIVSELATDVTLMLLAVVAYAADDLTQKDRTNALHILKCICVKGLIIHFLCSAFLPYFKLLFHFVQFQERHWK